MKSVFEQMMDLIPLCANRRFLISDEDQSFHEVVNNLRYGVEFRRFEIIVGNNFTSSTPPFRSERNRNLIIQWMERNGCGAWCFHKNAVIFEKEDDAILCAIVFA